MHLTKNYENSLTKSYFDAHKEKTIKAAKLKFTVFTAESEASASFKKTKRRSLEGPVSELFRFQKSAFFCAGAHSIAPTAQTNVNYMVFEKSILKAGTTINKTGRVRREFDYILSIVGHR